MKNKSLTMLAVLLILPSVLFAQNIFSGSDTFKRDFDERRGQLAKVGALDVFDVTLSAEEREALQFLYAYMALPDVVDYSGDFYRENVQYALRARAEMPWGASVPDREFLHFVLPVRVNNEDMDESRRVFFNELRDRVKGLSMYDAVLEVNHWCHEKVTYTPSDSRTSSPLASVRTAYGRCGEESTFTVAALRAVGIPARQVYTPRWAHTDDNHAWVEAWVDGKWYFLGACEPEPVLNLGWFNAPASRGILMHTKAFGNYNGPEEVLLRTACYTEINVTSNYAPVEKVKVKIVDEKGDFVAGADVEFKIYNYAEFFTAATKKSAADGTASLTIGRGDVIVWASKGGKYGYTKCTGGDAVTIVLDKAEGETASFELDITPPRERNTVPALTNEQKEQNAVRFAREDSIRNAYVATFIGIEKSRAIAAKYRLDEGKVVDFLKRSRGNHKTITTFIEEAAPVSPERTMGLLSAISDKDLRDISLDVLRDHFTNSGEGSGSEYIRYVLNPRVSNEMLTPYKAYLQSVIKPRDAERFRKDPSKWVKWCSKNIKVDATWNPLQLCMSPRGVWNTRTADAHSRDIFFVAAARAMGIPAYIDEVTGKTIYISPDGTHCEALFEAAQEAAPKGWLKAHFTPTKYFDDPRYNTHFSLSKIADGKLQLQNYPYTAKSSALFAGEGLQMDCGSYQLVTGTRMAGGGVRAMVTHFTVEEGKTTDIDLVMRESADELQVIGNFNSENLFYDLTEQRSRSLLSATGRGYYIIALIDPNSEPTNHFLRDVMPYKDAFEAWGQKIVLLFDSSNDAARFHADDFPDLPSTVVWGTDIDGANYKEIVTAMRLTAPQRPIILVADTFNRIVFVSQGYSIGLGEQLVKVINMLSE